MVTIHIPQASQGGGSVAVIDNLDSTATDAALSANQGRILEDELEALEAGHTRYTPPVAKNQTAFTLPDTPKDYSKVRMVVNGFVYETPEYLTVSGRAVTWLNAFPLDNTDIVHIYY